MFFVTSATSSSTEFLCFDFDFGFSSSLSSESTITLKNSWLDFNLLHDTVHQDRNKGLVLGGTLGTEQFYHQSLGKQALIFKCANNTVRV